MDTSLIPKGPMWQGPLSRKRRKSQPITSPLPFSDLSTQDGELLNIASTGLRHVALLATRGASKERILRSAGLSKELFFLRDPFSGNLPKLGGGFLLASRLKPPERGTLKTDRPMHPFLRVCWGPGRVWDPSTNETRDPYMRNTDRTLQLVNGGFNLYVGVENAMFQMARQNGDFF